MARRLHHTGEDLSARVQRGMLVFIDVGTQQGEHALTFQFNPDTVTRTRSGEWEVENVKDGTNPPRQTRTKNDAERGGGLYAKSETIEFTLFFDANDAVLSHEDSPIEMPNILPELALLEQMALGSAEAKKEEGSGGSSAPAQRKKKRPEVSGTEGQSTPAAASGPASFPLQSAGPSELLLILGERSFPVVLTNLTITEQRFDPEMNPTRAEVALSLRVLESSEVKNSKPTQHAFGELLERRRSWAGRASRGGSEQLQTVKNALGLS